MGTPLSGPDGGLRGQGASMFPGSVNSDRVWVISECLFFFAEEGRLARNMFIWRSEFELWDCAVCPACTPVEILKVSQVQKSGGETTRGHKHFKT